MKSAVSFSAIVTSVVLHAILIASLFVAEFSAVDISPEASQSMTMQVFLPRSASNSQVPQAVAPVRLTKKKYPHSKPAALQKPLARRRSTPVVGEDSKAPDLPLASNSVLSTIDETPSTSRVTPARPPSLAVPANASVSIPATYAASNRKPEYPALSRRYEEQGTVVLRVLVRADGVADTVEIKSSSGYPLLDTSARNTVQTWHFHPATREGKPIAEWYQLSIPFTLQH